MFDEKQFTKKEENEQMIRYGKKVKQSANKQNNTYSTVYKFSL